MWLGVWLLLGAGTAARKSIGFTLIFAPLPLARFFSALAGGGDEKVFMMSVAGVDEPPARESLLSDVLTSAATQDAVADVAAMRRG